MSELLFDFLHFDIFTQAIDLGVKTRSATSLGRMSGGNCLWRYISHDSSVEDKGRINRPEPTSFPSTANVMFSECRAQDTGTFTKKRCSLNWTTFTLNRLVLAAKELFEMIIDAQIRRLQDLGSVRRRNKILILRTSQRVLRSRKVLET
jgi:hypothetical protein